MTRARRSALVAVCLLGAVALHAPADAAAARKAKRQCPRADTKTVARNDVVRLFERKSGGNRRLYACLRRTQRTKRVVSSYDDGLYVSADYSNVRLAGYFVAWSYERTDVSCKADCPPGYNATHRSIGLYNLRSRGARDIFGSVEQRALVLTSSGVLAWARRASDGQIEVITRSRAGKQALLDRGAIPPSSLKLRDSTLVWANGGVERSAPLR
jgi:hypothetical protein